MLENESKNFEYSPSFKLTS